VAEGEDLAFGGVTLPRGLGRFDRPEEGDQRSLDLLIRRAAQVLLSRLRLPDSGAARSTRAVSGEASLSKGATLSAFMRSVRTAAPIPSPQRCSTAQTVREVLRNFGKIARLISLGARRRA
jgi:hypothetical protein